MGQVIGVGALLGVLGLFVLFLVVSLFQSQRDLKFTGWTMGAGLFGIIVGGASLLWGGRLVGLEMSVPVGDGVEELATAKSGGGENDDSQGGGGMMGGGGGGMMGGGGGGMMGGGGGGMMGGMGGGRGGGRGNASKRNLTALVRKLELVTGEISVTLTDKQVAAIGKTLLAAGSQEKMTDDEAKSVQEELEAVLTKEQTAMLAKVGLPRPPRSSGGGGWGGGRGGGRGQQPADGNPFSSETSGNALVSLLKRHGIDPPKIPKPPAAEETEGGNLAEGGAAGQGGEGSQGGGSADAVEVGDPLENLIKRYDKNGDGALSKEEVPNFLKGRIDSFDLNKDGKTDLAEMKEASRKGRGG